ncbi:hypothetical protein [Aeromonas caviae]|uniref:hypothetical protein n=1 Tax=Aeromonas caviae TaxID=648 RepID=UPI002B475B5A|nr:hypothetical protein [Aeromonas caviae]
MTIEHMPDGTKQFTSPEGVVTKHADMSAAMHYQRTGQRVGYDQPQSQQGEQQQQQTQEGRSAVDDFIDRCRNVGVARAARAVEVAK